MGCDVVSCGMKPQVRAFPVPLSCPLSYARDEEAAGSNPATPTEKQQVTGRLVTCCLYYAFSGVRFWEPIGSEHW